MIFVLHDDYGFAGNVVQYLGELGAHPVLRHIDTVAAEEVDDPARKGIVVCAGGAAASRLCHRIVTTESPPVPLFAIGPGHLAMAIASGASVVRSEPPMHGKSSIVHHDGRGLFAGLHLPFKAMRYDTYVVAGETLPHHLTVTARSAAGEVMALAHRRRPVVGVQFHPESAFTVSGKQIVSNFIAMTKNRRRANEKGRERSRHR